MKNLVVLVFLIFCTYDASVQSDEQIMGRLLNEINCQKKYGVQYFPIFLLDNGEHVGCCGLRPYNLNENIYEIGFHIRTNYWKKGFAYESTKAIMEFAFTEIKVTSLFAGHHPDNESSRYSSEIRIHI